MAASLLEVLTANLNYGARVVLEAIGPDEREALNKLELLLLGFRDEERTQFPSDILRIGSPGREV